MLRNTKSPSVYYQQLGRCLTADAVDKNPIVFDFVDNIIYVMDHVENRFSKKW